MRYVKFRRRSFMALAGAAGLLAAIPANAGLVFNYTYDSSIPTAELTEVKSSMNFIAGEFSSAYTNNVTLNFTIAYDPSVDLAQSSASYDYQGHSYDDIRTALLNNDPSLAADLPLVDPAPVRPNDTKGHTGSGLFSLTTANEKALGLAQTGDLVGSGTSDGTATFGSGPWTFYPSGPRKDDAKPTAFDFTGSMEHEISELMGRQSGLTQTVDWGYEPLDLSRFHAAGVRSFDPTTNAAGTAVSTTSRWTTAPPT